MGRVRGEPVQRVVRAPGQSRLTWEPPARMLSAAARVLVRARTRVAPRGGARDCSELSSSPQSFLGGNCYCFVVYMTPAKYLPQGFKV